MTTVYPIETSLERNFKRCMASSYVEGPSHTRISIKTRPQRSLTMQRQRCCSSRYLPQPEPLHCALAKQSIVFLHRCLAIPEYLGKDKGTGQSYSAIAAAYFVETSARRRRRPMISQVSPNLLEVTWALGSKTLQCERPSSLGCFHMQEDACTVSFF